eukprot:414036_1
MKEKAMKSNKNSISSKNLHHLGIPPRLKLSKSISTPMPDRSIRSFNISPSPFGVRTYRYCLDYLVPTLQSKLSFDLTRMCNINPRTKSCYFIIDGTQLHEESVSIYMDWHLNQKFANKTNKMHNNCVNTNYKDDVMDAWRMISLSGDKIFNNSKQEKYLFGLKNEFDYNGPLSIPFELVIFWWIYFFGWLCVISFLYFFTIFVAQELSPCSIHTIENNNEQSRLIAAIRYACLIMVFNAIGAGLIQLFIIGRIVSINHCKTILLLAEFAITICCIGFYFTH